MIERLLAGEAALARDDLEVAGRLFAQVADADPRNAIAVVGLARIAVARSDVEGARALARRALAIDPDEAAATRLLADLDAEPEAEHTRAPAGEPESRTEPQPGPALEPWPAPEPVTRALRAPQPASPRRGWRAWLARLLRLG